MTRYIFIDNYSGYIWGDSADINGAAVEGSPINVARVMDAALGEPDRRYENVYRGDIAANDSAYHVYRAPETFPLVTDGQDTAMIEAVERDCEYLGTILISDADDYDEDDDEEDDEEG
jgi:hypothetical protein